MATYNFSEISSVRNADRIPKQLFLDANFLLLWHYKDQQVCNFLNLIRPRGTHIHTSVRAVDEFYKAVIHSNLIQTHGENWLREKYKYGLINLEEELGDKLAKAENYVKYLDSKIKIESVCKKCLGLLKQQISNYNLLPGDASHIAFMKRHGLTAIATFDKDIATLERAGFDVYTNDKTFRALRIGIAAM